MEQTVYLAITIVSTSLLVNHLANKAIKAKLDKAEGSFHRIRETITEITLRHNETLRTVAEIDKYLVVLTSKNNFLDQKQTRTEKKTERAHQIIKNIQVQLCDRREQERKIDSYISQNFQNQSEFLKLFKQFLELCVYEDNRKIEEFAQHLANLPTEVVGDIGQEIPSNPITRISSPDSGYQADPTETPFTTEPVTYYDESSEED